MALAAPGDAAIRNTTGPRDTSPERLSPGCVVLTEHRFAVLWRRVAPGWIALPIIAQHAPLHRSHMILTPDELGSVFGLVRGRMLVLTGEPRLIVRPTEPLGRLGPSVLDRIERAHRRASEAALCEGVA